LTGSLTFSEGHVAEEHVDVPYLSINRCVIYTRIVSLVV
jgi:hypothetical protein